MAPYSVIDNEITSKNQLWESSFDVLRAWLNLTEINIEIKVKFRLLNTLAN